MKIEEIDLASPHYTPNKLLGEAAFVMHAQNNNQLGRLLEFNPAFISRIVNHKDPVTPGMLVRIMDRTGWSIAYTRALAGIPYDGMLYPPRQRSVSPVRRSRDYHIAKSHIVQAMPGTVDELASKSGYLRGTVEAWLKVLRAGDRLTRTSHIIDWRAPNGSGPYIAVHQAGPGEDAILVRSKWF